LQGGWTGEGKPSIRPLTILRIKIRTENMEIFQVLIRTNESTYNIFFPEISKDD
jgi:hypothetical protein